MSSSVLNGLCMQQRQLPPCCSPVAWRCCSLATQALLAALLSLCGGGGYLWRARQQAARAAAGSSHQQSLDEIRTNYDEQEGQAYQDLGEMDPDLQQEPAAGAGAAAVAAVGAAAADALAAGVGMASRVLTPRVKVRGSCCGRQAGGCRCDGC